MGFPAGYSDLMLPRVLLRIALLLGYVRHLICRAFEAAGLNDLLDSDAPWPDGLAQLDQPRQQQTQFRSVSAMMIQEALPVLRYEELRTDDQCVGGTCAVCLYEFEAKAEVRRLSNCRHVFHRGCLDRWLEHDQSTCPLCRTPLLPDETREAIDGQMWAAVGVPDSYYDDLYSFSAPPSSPSQPSPTSLILSHQLFSAY